MDLVRTAEFKNSFIFKYSERPGTKASERYPDDIPESVKKERNNDLLQVQNENCRKDHARFVGQMVSVLVEGPSKRGGGQLTGRTMTDHIVVFDGPRSVVGQILPMQIIEASPFTLYAGAIAGTDPVTAGPPERISLALA
jgi:tRNA-2-methylthio-N6-dimethylallyladenosine synthase